MQRLPVQVTSKSKNWNSSDVHPGLRWQFSVNTGITSSHGLSCGHLQVAPGAKLALHYHTQQEIYIITRGFATLLTGQNLSRPVTPGDTIYIPENSWHGVENSGVSILEFIWIFPTDSWQEIEYIFADDALNGAK